MSNRYDISPALVGDGVDPPLALATCRASTVASTRRSAASAAPDAPAATPRRAATRASSRSSRSNACSAAVRHQLTARAVSPPCS
ncbi:hypothetical protein [Sorangium sp. So ce1389]|uniref:hypothetical protein n=1 Tax=Sorangium sp. So ce1389 TaxID=3133336 RepID=UPI003F608B4A